MNAKKATKKSKALRSGKHLQEQRPLKVSVTDIHITKQVDVPSPKIN
jgi:hypothetical protein